MRHAHRSPSHAERAVLVAVEFTGQRRKLTAAVRLARKAAAVSAGTTAHEGKEASSPLASAQATGLDFDASLAEFEELARSAGAEVAATLIQRRPRPDPATLVGGGKLEEIAGVVASTEAVSGCAGSMRSAASSSASAPARSPCASESCPSSKCTTARSLGRRAPYAASIDRSVSAA